MEQLPKLKRDDPTAHSLHSYWHIFQQFAYRQVTFLKKLLKKHKEHLSGQWIF